MGLDHQVNHDDVAVWTAKTSIIWFTIVEMHQSDRVKLHSVCNNKFQNLRRVWEIDINRVDDQLDYSDWRDFAKDMYRHWRNRRQHILNEPIIHLLDQLNIIWLDLGRLQGHNLCLNQGILLIHVNEFRHHTLNNKWLPNNQPHTLIKPKKNVNPPKLNYQPHTIIIPYTFNLAINSCHTPKLKTRNQALTTNNHTPPPHLSIAQMIHMIQPHPTIAPHLWTPKHLIATTPNHCLTFLHRRNHCFVFKTIQCPNPCNHTVHNQLNHNDPTTTTLTPNSITASNSTQYFVVSCQLLCILALYHNIINYFSFTYLFQFYINIT